MAEIRLKPCPFCGGEAQIARTMHMGMRTYRFFAICLVCGAKMPRTSRTMTQAAKAWNKRADIEDISANNIVVVVRCKDCIYRGRPDCAMFYRCDCGEQHTWETDNDYCSYGKRRSDNG